MVTAEALTLLNETSLPVIVSIVAATAVESIVPSIVSVSHVEPTSDVNTGLSYDVTGKELRMARPSAPCTHARHYQRDRK